MRAPARPPVQAIQHAGAVLLQREIPDVVNVIFAKVRSSLVRLAIYGEGSIIRAVARGFAEAARLAPRHPYRLPCAPRCSWRNPRVCL